MIRGGKDLFFIMIRVGKDLFFIMIRVGKDLLFLMIKGSCGQDKYLKSPRGKAEGIWGQEGQ